MFVVKILPSLLIIVLMTCSVVTEERENKKGKRTKPPAYKNLPAHNLHWQSRDADNPYQDVVAAHKLDSLCYTDDYQLYTAIHPNDHSRSLATLRNCIKDVIDWNTWNMPLCNPGKTEVIQFTSALSELLHLIIYIKLSEMLCEDVSTFHVRMLVNFMRLITGVILSLA